MPTRHRGSLPVIISITLLAATLGLTACSSTGGGSNDRIYGEGGFYFDRSVNQWRDPDGEVCHTCTPENGFKDYSR